MNNTNESMKQAYYPVKFETCNMKKGKVKRLSTKILMPVDIGEYYRNWCWITPVGGEGKVRVLKTKVILK